MVIFDEWEGKAATVDEMAEAIRTIDARHGITEDDISWSGCDPAGAAKTDSGISSVERLRRKGFRLLWRTSEIMTGVELIKTMLKDAAGRVSLKFCPTTKRTLYHLQHYRWETGNDHPDKDNLHDHAMDALRYLIINLLGKKPVNWTGAKVAGAEWR